MSEPFRLSRLLAFLMVREQVDVVGMGMFSADDVAERMLATPEGRALEAVVKSAVALARIPIADLGHPPPRFWTAVHANDDAVAAYFAIAKGDETVDGA